jgi:hypothetical protein
VGLSFPGGEEIAVGAGRVGSPRSPSPVSAHIKALFLRGAPHDAFSNPLARPSPFWPSNIKDCSGVRRKHWDAFGVAKPRILGRSTIRRGSAIYQIINIGASFSNKDQKRLEAVINNHGEQGWRFHSVFSVESRGCLGFFRQTTNFMVLEAAWARGSTGTQISANPQVAVSPDDSSGSQPS